MSTGIKGAGREVTFDPNYPIKDLRPADYNPRRLSEDAFVRLQASLKKWGVVKPVIVNGDGTIVAGHQRTKALTALGVDTCAAVVLPRTVRMLDEVRFNLLHNRVETETSDVLMPPGDIGAWTLVDADEIVVRTRENASFRQAIGQMLGSHGPWGSVVVDDQGRVVLNAEYAVVCADMKAPCLAYTIPSAAAHELYTDLTGEYGVYDWSRIEAPVYNQHIVQPRRLRKHASEAKAGKQHMKSSTWEEYVLPWLTKDHRVVDFGSGYGDYAKMLRAKGFQVADYEPFRCVTGSYAVDVKQVVSDVHRLGRLAEKEGLFEVVVLDSVINATTSLEYQDAVIKACIALMRRDAVLVIGTRGLEAETRQEKSKRHAGYQNGLTFLDENNVEMNFRMGKWQTLRFHSEDSLRSLLLGYFDDVVVKDPNRGNMHALCRLPKPIDPKDIEAALDIELNMPLPPTEPGGEPFHHGRHKRAVSQLVAAYRKDRALGD